MDVLADVLAAIRLTASVFFTAEMSEPWAVASPAGEQLSRVLLPSAECVALFHVLVDGHCVVLLDDTVAPVPMQSGDVIIFPHGDAHVMMSGAPVPACPISAVLPPVPWDGIPQRNLAPHHR